MRWFVVLTAALVVGTSAGWAQKGDGENLGRLSREGVVRATATVDSVFVDRTLPKGKIEGGDWASYLLARLGAGPIPDSLGIIVRVDTAGIEVRGRLQDLPLEARALLGPLATTVDSTTVISALVGLQRTGRQIVRFWLRGLRVNGFPFPEFLLGPMMAQVGRQYPSLTASGRDLYVQIPSDGVVRLGQGAVLISIDREAGGGAGGRDSSTHRPPPARETP